MTSAPASAQRLDEVGQRLAVQLDRDALAFEVVVVDQVLEHLARRLRLRRPGLAQAARPDGALGLGSAGEDGGLADRGGERLGQVPGLGGVDPAAEADAGGGDDDVQRSGQAAARSASRSSVSSASGTMRMAGRVDDLGAAAFEGGAELLAPAGGRDADGVAGQRLGRRGSTWPDRSRGGPRDQHLDQPVSRRTGNTGTARSCRRPGRLRAQVEHLLVQGAERRSRWCRVSLRSHG